MIWPAGNFYQEAKSQAASALMSGTKVHPKYCVSLTEWRKFSSISTISSSKNQIIIECNSAELASSILGEIEVWADRELEMRAQILRAAQSSGGFQESWFVVSCYYWAVFSACLLLRLLGIPVFRMVSSEISTLRSLLTNSPNAIFPGEGTFRLNKHAEISVTKEQVMLTRLKHNYHQSLWVTLISTINGIHNATKIHNSNSVEKNIISYFLGAFEQKNGRLSDLRNLVNYKTGIGFPADCRGVGFSLLAEARSLSTLDINSLLFKMSNASTIVQNQPLVAFNKEQSTLLLYVGVLLSIMSQTLYAEVSKIIRFDASWIRRRLTFGASNDVGVPKELRSWLPF